MRGYKLNIDVSYYDNGTGSVGAVLRNRRGEVKAGMACVVDHVLNGATAKALALLKGLQFLESVGCSSVIIESDSLELIQVCNGEIAVWSPYSAILAECFSKASMMEDVSFQHCMRDANQVAHQLAKHVYQSKENLVWDGDPPGFILPYL